MHSERLRWTTITIAIFFITLITSSGLLACVRKTVTPASTPASTPPYTTAYTPAEQPSEQHSEQQRKKKK